MTHFRTSLACVLVLAATACSRQSPESRPPSEAPTLTPAAGPATPQPRQPVRRCSQNFQMFDANADGRLSRDEFTAHPHAHGDPSAIFAQRDRDADGSLTESELCAGFRQTPGRPAAGPGPGAGMGPGHNMGPRAGMGPGRGGTHPDVAPKGPRCEQHFDAFDADQDGKLTKEEFASRPHVHGDADLLFAERDLNQDSILTREEFCSAWSR